MALCHPSYMSLIEAHVRVLAIGNHFGKAETERLLGCLEKGGFRIEANEAYNAGRFKPQVVLREGRDWPRIRAEHLYFDSPQGPINNFDGHIIAHNKRFHDKAFTRDLADCSMALDAEPV